MLDRDADELQHSYYKNFINTRIYFLESYEKFTRGPRKKKISRYTLPPPTPGADGVSSTVTSFSTLGNARTENSVLRGVTKKKCECNFTRPHLLVLTKISSRYNSVQVTTGLLEHICVVTR